MTAEEYAMNVWKILSSNSTRKAQELLLLFGEQFLGEIDLMAGELDRITSRMADKHPDEMTEEEAGVLVLHICGVLDQLLRRVMSSRLVASQTGGMISAASISETRVPKPSTFKPGDPSIN